MRAGSKPWWRGRSSRPETGARLSLLAPLLLAGTRVSSECQRHKAWLLGPHDRQPHLPDTMHPVHMRGRAWLRVLAGGLGVGAGKLALHDNLSHWTCPGAAHSRGHMT